MDTAGLRTPEITRRDFLKLAGASLAVLGLSQVLTPQAAKAVEEYAGKSSKVREKPNVLWIVMDTVRADHLSCYSHHRNTTPNIDRIASEGALFQKAFATAPWTQPSHASMFTGMFPAKHGVDSEHGRLDGRFRTIAEVLRSHGYQAFAYTNNVTVDPEMAQGFDIYERLNRGLSETPERRRNPKASLGLADFLKINDARRYAQNLLLMDDGAYRTNQVVKRWIADAHQAETPFFVFINYMEPHRPYKRLPAPYATLYQDENVNLADVQKLASGILKNPTAYIARRTQVSDEDFRILRDLYDGEISYLDFRMGQLFDYLKELEVLDNTVLIITSDHGENFGEHGLMGHSLCVYDTLLHVPLVVRFPASFEAGARVDEQVQLTDIFPTILDITGIEWEGRKDLQGHSLLKDRRQSDSRFTIAEHGIWLKVLDTLKRKNPKFDASIYARRLKAVRTEQFKYVWASDGRDELYDIYRDPKELNNLIETQPEKARELKALLVDWLDSFETYRPGVAQEVAR